MATTFAHHKTGETNDRPPPASSIYLRIAMILLLLGCLARMPYGYYQIVRFAGFVAFGILSFQFFNANRSSASILFGCLALLFQPFIKIALGRTIWNVVDVIVAIILLAMLISDTKARVKT